MSSPARKHFERRTAALTAAENSGEERAPLNANQYELMLGKLAEDKRRLHAIQSMEKKAQLKAELTGDYLPWIRGVIEGNSGVQDDVLMTVMVWCIDARQLDLALDIARYAIKHQLAMPDQYERSTAVVIAEEFADILLKQHAADAPIDITILQGVMELTLDKDMPDQVKAKLHKALGYALLNPALVPHHVPTEADRLDYALKSFKAAVALHDKVGVKKDIERLEREIKNSAAPAKTA
jgi:Phage small terminase subunit.